MSSTPEHDAREHAKQSRTTLLRFLADVRDELLEIPDFCSRMTVQLGKSHIRKQICGWLQLHHDRLNETTNEKELLERSLADQLQARNCRPGSVASKSQFVASLLNQLNNYDPAQVESISQEMLAAGLGVAFMRYSEASRFSYYHTLEMGVLPNKTRDTIVSTALVPDWSGTIGWMSREAWLMLRQRPPVTPKWQFLSSCFYDPKGRVAMEDLVLGNRSFAAIPVLERHENSPVHRIIGIVFCFLPVDGLFVEDCGQNPLPKVQDVLDRQWQRREEGLLHALQVEAVTTLYQNSRRSSLADIDRMYSHGSDADEDDQTRRVKWLKQTLLAEGVSDPSDPLGLQLVVDVEQDLSTGEDVQPARCQFLFREEAFVREVFRRLQLSCRCPTRWAPRFAWDMQAVHDFFHDAPAVASCFPIWRVDTAARLNGDRHDMNALPLYPDSDDDAFQRFVDRMHTISANATFAANQTLIHNIYGQMPDLSNDWQSGQSFDDDDPFRLNRVLRHHSAPDRMVDLVVPLMFERKCTGFFRIKCWCEESLQTLSPKSRNLLQSFYELFAHDFTDLGNAIAHLLSQFEHHCDQITDDLPRLKTWLDMRLAFCDALADGLCRGLSTESEDRDTFDEQLTLVVSAAQIESQAVAAEQNEDSSGACLDADTIRSLAYMISNCQRQLASFVKTATTRDLPAVTLVSVWLARERPTIIGAGVDLVDDHPSNPTDNWARGFLESDKSGRSRLHYLFIDDPGLIQQLRMFLRWSRQRDHTSIDYRQSDVHTADYVVVESPSGSTVPGLPSGFRAPPIHLAEKPADTEDRGLGCCRSVQFRTRSVAVGDEQIDVSHTIFALNDTTCGLRLDWQWSRAPIPVAVAHVPHMVNRSLFRSDDASGVYNIRFTASARALFREPSSHDCLLPLTELLESVTHDSPGGIPSIVHRVNDILQFLPNEEHSSRSDCRFVFTTVGDIRYAILAHGQIPIWGNERPIVEKLRNDAIMGALADVALLMQTSAVKWSRDHNTQIRFLGHQLKNDLGEITVYLDTLSNVLAQTGTNEECQRLNVLKDRFANLRCLIRCLTRSEKGTREFTYSVANLLKTVAAWKLSGHEDDIVLESSGLTDGASMLHFDATTMRDLFLVFNNLINNAIYAAQSSKARHICLESEVLPGLNKVRVTIRNTSREELPDDIALFVMNDDPDLEVPLPRKRTGEQCLGLWTIRQLLHRNNFGRAAVTKENRDDGEWNVLFQLQFPVEAVK